MNRDDFQKLAKDRLEEADSLINDSKFNGSYYLCGYVIECALKACIAKKTKEYDFPDKKIVEQSYKHDLSLLLKIAELETKFNAKIKADSRFESNWLIVKDWTENSRYNFHPETKARQMYSATEGVLEWLKQYW